ncbi:hypothetical protein Tco_1250659 [Tanacetum coccineum]
MLPHHKEEEQADELVEVVVELEVVLVIKLRNLPPTIVPQVGDQGKGQENGKNQNSNAINANIRGDVRNVIGNNDCKGCTYKVFLACNPKEYDRKGGAVVYTHWIENMESVQDISGCGDNQKVKYIAGSFVSKALTWWNSQIRTLGQEVAVGMSWYNFKVLMREELCPSNEARALQVPEIYKTDALASSWGCPKTKPRRKNEKRDIPTIKAWSSKLYLVLLSGVRRDPKDTIP